MKIPPGTLELFVTVEVFVTVSDNIGTPSGFVPLPVLSGSLVTSESSVVRVTEGFVLFTGRPSAPRSFTFVSVNIPVEVDDVISSVLVAVSVGKGGTAA